MQKLISKYATAAHLAILAVAPLLLLPWVGPQTTAAVVGWLSVFSFVWVVMEPSRRSGEMLHNSRQRVARAVLTDPMFWFSGVIVAYAGVRALNGGVCMAYDAELMVWTIRSPDIEMLPGCVSGSGWLSFSLLFSLAIVFQGVRHTLGRSARSAFLLIVSVLSSLAAVVMIVVLSYGSAAVAQLACFSYFNASFFGTSFGIAALVGVVALFSSVERGWLRAEPIAAISLTANLTALTVFSPPLTAAAFVVVCIVLVACSFVTMRRVFEGSASFRCALAVLISLAAPVLYCIATADAPYMVERIRMILAANPFPDWYWETRRVLFKASVATWKSHPWIGTGLESFPLDLRFALSDADWSVVATQQMTPLNGWLMLLVERGVIGALILAVTIGLLIWTYVARLVASISEIRMSPELFLGPLVLVVTVALTFFDCSMLRPEVMLIAGSAIAFSGGALPERERRQSEGKDR